MDRVQLTMLWSTLGLTVVIGIVACQTMVRRDLDPGIGPPIPEKYRSIRDAQDWLNPYLSVCPQGVILSVRSLNRVNDTVPIESLRAALLDLPVTAWPYGQIVALQDCSLGVPGDMEDSKTRMKKVESVLSALGIAMSRWPS